jgi:hypothetical protein
MFCNGHQGGIEDGAGGAVCTLACQQQVKIITKIDVPNQIACQVSAAHHDGVFVGRADGRSGDGGFANFHNKTPVSGG